VEQCVPATRGRQRDYPYYKVQLRDPILNVWKDHRREAFDGLAEAVAYRSTITDPGETRITEWHEDGPRGLSDDEIAARQ
jgi:hypothetical protein